MPRKTEINTSERALTAAMTTEYENVETIAARLFKKKKSPGAADLRHVRNNLRWPVQAGLIERDPDRRGFYRLPLNGEVPVVADDGAPAKKSTKAPTKKAPVKRSTKAPTHTKKAPAKKSTSSKAVSPPRRVKPKKLGY